MIFNNICNITLYICSQVNISLEFFRKHNLIVIQIQAYFKTFHENMLSLHANTKTYFVTKTKILLLKSMFFVMCFSKLSDFLDSSKVIARSYPQKLSKHHFLEINSTIQLSASIGKQILFVL